MLSKVPKHICFGALDSVKFHFVVIIAWFCDNFISFWRHKGTSARKLSVWYIYIYMCLTFSYVPDWIFAVLFFVGFLSRVKTCVFWGVVTTWNYTWCQSPFVRWKLKIHSFFERTKRGNSVRFSFCCLTMFERYVIRYCFVVQIPWSVKVPLDVTYSI